jgi:hypothetical protein
MEKDLLEKLKQWNIASVLPPSVGDFSLTVEQKVVNKGEKEEVYHLFTYANPVNGWSVRGVFNPGSEEFSVRTDIGMLEFALIEFITSDFAAFCRLTEKRLANLIRTHYVERGLDFSVILRNKGVPEMAWQDILPMEYKGFTCQITPSSAVRIINGSYMIVSYYNADKQSGLSIMYNILRDDFFAERRIHHFPNLVHDFDSHTIKELTDSLKEHLLPVLDELAVDAE